MTDDRDTADRMDRTLANERVRGRYHPSQARHGTTSTRPACLHQPHLKTRPRLPDPTSVLADTTLSHDEKVATLRRWCLDAREIESANTDGMGGPVRASNLQALHAALRTLGATETVTEA